MITEVTDENCLIEDNVEDLDCNGYLPNLSQYTSIKRLFISNTPQTSVSHSLINLTRLNADATDINYIPDTLINMLFLSVCRTNVRTIPSTLINLISLECSHTDVDFIPETFKKLKILDCSNTLVKNIPKLEKLETLNCSFSKVRILKTYLENLKNLSCINSGTVNSKYVLWRLEELTCHNMNFYQNVVFERLKTLKVSGHFGYYMGRDIFPKLETLNCENSSINLICPTLTTLRHLSAENSGITSIPENIFQNLESLSPLTLELSQEISYQQAELMEEMARFLNGEIVQKPKPKFENYENYTQSTSEENCVICTEVCGECKIHTCGNVFHDSCIKKWYENSQTCPMCRNN